MVMTRPAARSGRRTRQSRAKVDTGGFAPTRRPDHEPGAERDLTRGQPPDTAVDPPNPAAVSTTRPQPLTWRPRPDRRPRTDHNRVRHAASVG
jgi:hypothetical protein